ncbi:MAG TPA: C80 family cysteine peptidase [Longimicrobium sp.]|jgi:hypothetical protein
MAYDKQLIVVLHPASAPHLQTLKDGAAALKSAKGISDALVLDPNAVSVESSTHAKFRALTQHSRLYIIAHGGTTIGGSKPGDLAAFLSNTCGLREVGKIVLIMCGSKTALETAQDFHRALGELHDIRSDMHGYLSEIKIIDANDMKLVQELAGNGITKLDWKLGERRLKIDGGQSLSDWKKPRDSKLSKYIFGWDADIQMFDLVY